MKISWCTWHFRVRKSISIDRTSAVETVSQMTRNKDLSLTLASNGGHTRYGSYTCYGLPERSICAGMLKQVNRTLVACMGTFRCTYRSGLQLKRSLKTISEWTRKHTLKLRNDLICVTFHFP